MNRQDAEDLARAYCLRQLNAIHAEEQGRSWPQAERLALDEARARYGSGLTAAAISRIRKKLRDNRAAAIADALATR